MQNSTSGRIQVGPDVGSARPVNPDEPFRMLVIGDFSGRRNRLHDPPTVPLAERKWLSVDRDNVDTIMQRFDVRLTELFVADGETPVELTFQELDQFEPDHLYDQVELFSSLRSLRRRLSKPATFEAAASELAGWKSPQNQAESSEEAATEPQPIDDLLDDVLAESQTKSSRGIDWQRLLGSLVDPYVESLPDRERQAALLKQVDGAARATMTALLHHPDFRDLEAIWRSVHLLVRRLETDRQLQVFLLDVSKEELDADFSREDPTSASLYQRLVEREGGPESLPWSVIVAHYEFGDDPADAATLAGLAAIAARASAAVLSAGTANLVGCSPQAANQPRDWQPAPPAGWNELVARTEASHIALLWPRFLLRLPYGAKWRPIERFDFEEVTTTGNARLLWGNPAILAAILLGQSYTHLGWKLTPGALSEIDGLPIWVYEDEDGDEQVRPCGEVGLADVAVERVTASGIVPVISYREQDKIRIAPFQSIQGSPLRGPWDG